MIYIWFTSAVCHEQSKYIFDWPTPKIFQSLSKVDRFLNQPQKCEINNYVKINKHCKKYGINQHYNVLIEKHCKNVELVNALIDQHCKKCWGVEKFIYAECDSSAKRSCCCVIYVLPQLWHFIFTFYILYSHGWQFADDCSFPNMSIHMTSLWQINLQLLILCVQIYKNF